MTKTHEQLNRKGLWSKTLATLALACLLIPAVAASAESVLQGGPHSSLQVEPTFKFVVIGDTRTGVSVFERCIAEINLLAPDLVLDVGDLIEGYKEDIRQIIATWDEFDERVKKFQVPLVMVAGNHDIWGRDSRKIYEQRYGKTYFSFDHKGVHFVVLDSEAFDDNDNILNRIDDEQLKWLQNDLALHHNARLTFVFLHKPFWQGKRFDQDATKHWFKRVHPILAKHRVTAVFAGHVHGYVKFPPVDGVHYYITGGGGAGIGQDPTMGDFHHYCLLSVSGNEWKLAIIKPGSIEPDTIITTDVQALGTAPEIEVPESGHTVPIELAFFSWKTRSLEITARPSDSPSLHWRVTPYHLTVSARSDEQVHFRFTASVDPQHAYPVPQFTFEVRDQGKRPQLFTCLVPVKAHRTTTCRKTVEPPHVDGKLDDTAWATTAPLSAFFTPRGDKQTSFPTQVQSTYDSNNLYLAFRCQEPNLAGLVTKVSSHDGPVCEDDSVEIFIDTNLDRKTYYQFVFNAKGVAYDGSGMSGKWNGQHNAKTSRTMDAWTLEIAIPWQTIGVKAPKPGTKVGLQIVRTRVQSPRELTQWSPTFAGNHVPTQFGTMIFK